METMDGKNALICVLVFLYVWLCQVTWNSFQIADASTAFHWQYNISLLVWGLFNFGICLYVCVFASACVCVPHTQIQGCLRASAAVMRLLGLMVSILLIRSLASGVTVSHSGDGNCQKRMFNTGYTLGIGISKYCIYSKAIQLKHSAEGMFMIFPAWLKTKNRSFI